MENVNQKIQTIVLCGGMGTRMREETEFKPKPMVTIGEMPIMWHIMKIYAHYGYKDFLLALGYKSEHITDYLREQDNFKDYFNILPMNTGVETPHGERVLMLKDQIKEDMFMVTYGDGVADIDIKKLVEFHKNKGRIGTITGVHPISRWGLIKVNDDLVTEFRQKPSLYDYSNGGFMIFNKEFFNYLRPGDMIEDGLSRLIEDGQLSMYKHEGFWYGMDTYRDFLFLNKVWKEDPKWKIWKKNVLVTGGAGFIGSHLVDKLIEEGHNVSILDNLSSGKEENINPKAKFYKMDIQDPEIIDIFDKEKFDTVFHLAAQAIVDTAYENPLETIKTNIIGTANILEICRKRNNISSIIIVSSDKAYGKAKELPYKESSPLSGDHPYDFSKSATDLLAQTYYKTYNMPIAITRFSNTFGPRDPNLSRIIPGIFESIIENKELQVRSNGKLVREYTNVKDIVDGCIKLSENIEKVKGEAFNFGSNNIFNVVNLIKKVEEILNVKVNYKILNIANNEIPEQYLDYTKASHLLNWKPETNFEQEIKESFAWYQSKKIIS